MRGRNHRAHHPSNSCRRIWGFYLGEGHAGRPGDKYLSRYNGWCVCSAAAQRRNESYSFGGGEAAHTRNIEHESKSSKLILAINLCSLWRRAREVPTYVTRARAGRLIYFQVRKVRNPAATIDLPRREINCIIPIS